MDKVDFLLTIKKVKKFNLLKILTFLTF